MTSSRSSTNRILKHSTIYAIGNVLRQLAGFIMLPIYTRFLSPADYGVIGLLTFAMSIMEAFFGARLGEAMPKYYSQEQSIVRKNAVISTALIITGVASAITSIVLFLFKEETASLLFGSHKYSLAVGLFGMLMLTQAVEYYGMTYIRILQKPTLFIGVSLSKLIVQLSLNIVLVVGLKLEVMGVVISGVAASSVYAFGLAIFIIRKTGVRMDWSIAKTMLNFCWPLWFVGLASIYIYSANRYYIRVFGSLSEVGLYELAVKFGMILMLLAWQPFNQFWETERFNFYQQENSRKIFSTAFQFISTCLLALALCVGIAAEPIIRIMSAPDFHKAYLAVPILTIGFLISCMTNFVNFSFLVKDKTRSISHIGYLTAALITVLNLALIPLFGYIGAALAFTIALLFQFLMSFYKGRVLYDMGIDIRPTMLLLGLTVVMLFMATFVFHSVNIWMDILLKGLLLVFSLGMFLLIFWRTTTNKTEISSLINSFRSRFAG